jgi:hypothetical protein
MSDEIQRMLSHNAELLTQNTCDIATVKLQPLTPDNQEKLKILENDRRALTENIKILQKLSQLPTDEQIEARLREIHRAYDTDTFKGPAGSKDLLLSAGQSKGPSLQDRADKTKTPPSYGLQDSPTIRPIKK